MKNILYLTILLLALNIMDSFADDKNNWKELNFWRYKNAEFKIINDEIQVTSKSASSMLYKRLSEEEEKASNLSWQWKVESSNVPPTALNIKKNDDRILGFYVFFTKEPLARKNKSLPSNGKYIAYIWGSKHRVGEVINSPDGMGKYIIIKPHISPHKQWFLESKNYKEDFKTAFSFKAYPAFIAIAADTDDSKTLTKAAIKSITFSNK